jgi:hypothetical protein
MKKKERKDPVDDPAGPITEEPKRLIVGVELLADALNITPRRVQQFKKDGTFKDAGAVNTIWSNVPVPTFGF